MLTDEQQREYEKLTTLMGQGKLDSAGYQRRAELEDIKAGRPIVGKRNSPPVGYDRSVVPTSLRGQLPLGKFGGKR